MRISGAYDASGTRSANKGIGSQLLRSLPGIWLSAFFPVFLRFGRSFIAGRSVRRTQATVPVFSQMRAKKGRQPLNSKSFQNTPQRRASTLPTSLATGCSTPTVNVVSIFADSNAVCLQVTLTAKISRSSRDGHLSYNPMFDFARHSAAQPLSLNRGNRDNTNLDSLLPLFKLSRCAAGYFSGCEVFDRAIWHSI